MHDARDSQPHASDTLVNAILDAFVEALPAYLVSQRWFADKHRTIASISITDFSLVETGQTTLLLAIAGVRFTDRTTARYFVPAVLDGHPRGPVELSAPSRMEDGNSWCWTPSPAPVFMRG